MDIQLQIKALESELTLMERYLELKRVQRDWHGVADAAMDIRELEAKLKVLREL